MPVLQAADPRAGERVPLQRLRQQGQTHSAVSPTESDGPVRCLPTHVLYHKNTSYIIILVLCAARGFVQLKIPTWNAAAKGQPCCSWGLGAEVTVTSPTAGVLPLWQLCGVMPLPYWCLLSFKIMAVFFLKDKNVFWLNQEQEKKDNVVIKYLISFTC